MRYKEPEVVIPELEKMAKTHHSRAWTDKQVRTLERYYNKVPIRSLAKYVGKSVDACRNKADSIGITGGRE